MVRLTAEQFAEQLFDFPDGGRWTELQAGEVLTLEPPDDLHGTIVLNLSKALAASLETTVDRPVGYPCFEVGVIVGREPDTVRRPPVSFFAGDRLFAEMDEPVATSVPRLVVEIAAGSMRRRTMSRRIEEYQAAGVEHIWVIDTIDRIVQTCPRGESPRTVAESELLAEKSILPGFAIPVSDLFAVPKWWAGT